ncbi:MAG: sigma-70 family RNA polymerase sigma factor [Actinomycetota bacterium]
MPLSGLAAARLYDDHVDGLHAMVARRVGPTHAPNVTAEVFEHALRTWDRFEASNATERNFLLGAATIVLRRHTDRERAHLVSIPDPTTQTTPMSHDPLVVEQTPHEEESVRESQLGGGSFGAAMTTLVDMDPQWRDVLLLSLWERLSSQSIAEAMDLSPNSVRSLLSKARRALKAAR